MAKKKKKTRKRKKGPVGGTPATVHHLLDPKDIAAWGAGTMCGKRAKSGNTDHTKVTCKSCKKYTNWNVTKYRDASSDPIHL